MLMLENAGGCQDEFYFVTKLSDQEASFKYILETELAQFPIDFRKYHKQLRGTDRIWSCL